MEYQLEEIGGVLQSEYILLNNVILFLSTNIFDKLFRCFKWDNEQIFVRLWVYEGRKVMIGFYVYMFRFKGEVI